jgi:serine/threonine protein kinase
MSSSPDLPTRNLRGREVPVALSDAPSGPDAEQAAPPSDCPTTLYSPPPAAELPRIGTYRLLSLLGQGGMGVVYRAHDPHLGRDVAVKVLLPTLAADPEARSRFLREARAAAALAHDNIVAVHQVGEADGTPFLVMELLAGMSLANWLQRGRKVTVGQIVRIGRDVARGLAAAHARGLVHRDIKPANLWLEKTPGPGSGRGASAAGFRVKILDFSLARPIDSTAELTRDGTIVGTPNFVAPEQAAGQPLDGRADLFSLGCVLYQLGTGRLPFPGDCLFGAVEALVSATPPPVRALNPDIPAPLSDLIMRLLARDPAGRPATAGEVEEELRALGRSAREPSRSENELPQPARRPVRRRRWRLLTAALAALAGALLGWAVLLPGGGRRPVWASGDEGAPPLRPVAPPPRTVRLIPQGVHLAHANEIRCLAYSGDGRYLATGSFDQTAALWKVSTMRVVARLGGRRGVVEAVAFSADGTTLATAHSCGELCLWRVPDGKLLGARLAHPGGTNAVAFPPTAGNGWLLASGGVDGLVCLWPQAQARPLRLAGHKSGVDTVAVSPDGSRLASGSGDRTVRIWDAKTGASLAELRGFTDRVSHLVFGPTGRLLATADADEQCVRLWDLSRRGAAPRRLRLSGNVHGVAFSPDGRWLATASQRSEGVALWDVSTGKRVDVGSGVTQYPWAVAFAPDGKQIAAGDYAALKIWKVKD